MVYRVPVPTGAFRRLVCVAAGRLLLFNAFNDELQVVDIPLGAKHGDLEAKFLCNGVNVDFAVSPNGERVLVKRLGRLFVAECDWGDRGASLSMELSEAQALRISDLHVRVNPVDEWREVFVDAWRQARDAFWDKAMGGVDWPAMFAKYEKDLPRIGCQSELHDLIRRLYAELRTLHVYVYPHGEAQPTRPHVSGPPSPPSFPDRPSFLGGVLRAATDAVGGVEVVALYAGETERQQLAPLASPHYGDPVETGERIVGVNGRAVGGVLELGEALLGQAERQVRLRVWTPERLPTAADEPQPSAPPAALVTYVPPTPRKGSVLGAAVSALTGGGTVVDTAAGLLSLSAPASLSGLLSVTGLASASSRSSSSRSPGGTDDGSGRLRARAEHMLDAGASSAHCGVLAAPDGWQARDVIVVPILHARFAKLRHDAWLYRTRRQVESASGGRVGYVSLRSMEREVGYTSFAEQYYPVHGRPGLILDVRHNRGGNIDAWLLERLARKAWAYFQPRVGGGYWGTPYSSRCHMVCLCDQMTQSNAEFFAEGFRRHGLGPVVGKRTWGGGIWISFGHWLQDGSALGLPEIGAYAEDKNGPSADGGRRSRDAGLGSEWIIEGRGVEPDVDVDNEPAATFGGADAQLDAAVKMLLERLEAEPIQAPGPPPYPRRV